MGISCASEIFTVAIRVRLANLPGQLNMTDDVLVFGKTAEEHHKNFVTVLTRLEEIGLIFNQEKCRFYKKELTFFRTTFLISGYISNWG